MTGVIAGLVEAWSEVRVHKVRVVLSLVAITLAVLAMTGITALGDMARQAAKEDMERWGGRPATLGISAYSESAPLDQEQLGKQIWEVVDRYKITYASSNTMVTAKFRFPSGPGWVQLQVVDQPYGEMHRLKLTHGAWFVPQDADRFAPALIVNEAFLRALGISDLTSHPTVTTGGDRPVVATVVGAVANDYPGAEPSAFILRSAAERWGVGDPMAGPGQVELWVPPDQEEQLRQRIVRDIQAATPEGTQVDVYRMDSGHGIESIDAQLTWAIRGVSLIALGLASLGLVNIALVTVRYRIREIGIRRSFGATSGRVFFSVMMESVWATVVAGLIGVAIAVAIIKNLPPELFEVTDLPPFPVRAAVEGMIAATLVGALSGLMPAIIAVRVKVIDAIRY